MLASRILALCLQAENSSLLLLRVAPSGLNIIRYFSSRQSLQALEEGSYPRPLSRILQLIVCGVFVFLRLQMCWLNVVAFCWSMCFKFEVCPVCLFLNVPAVRPVYVSVFCVPSGEVAVTVAWYTRPAVYEWTE